MDGETTIILLGGGLALLGLAMLGDRARQRAPLAWHAHLPWHSLSFLGVAVVLFGAAHLLALARGS